MDAASAILIKRGFHIGREVKTTKRTTTSVVTDGTTTRHDVPQNTNAFIVCVRGASVRISTLLNMKDGLVPIEFNMNSDSLALWDGAKDDEQKIKPGKAQKVKTFDIVLGDSDPSDVSVKVAWHKQAESACATELFEAKTRISRVTTNMEYVNSVCPTYTDKDLIVVERNGVSEVWTMRAFKPREILVPCISSDIRTAYWTRFNAQSVPFHSKGKHTNKNLVVDGKHLGSIEKVDQPGRGYSLFWAFGRTLTKKEATLEITALRVHDTVVVEGVPTKAEKGRDFKVNLKDLEQPMIPCAFNPASVGKHTQLVMPVDTVLKNMELALAKEKADRDLKVEMAAKRKFALSEKTDSKVLADAAAELKRHKRRRERHTTVLRFLGIAPMMSSAVWGFLGIAPMIVPMVV